MSSNFHSSNFHSSNFHSVGTTTLSPQNGNEKEVDENSIFWLASLGKIVTVVGVLKCIELFPSVLPLGLDTDVTSFLPKICGQIIQEDLSLQPATKKITFRNLLTHTSGLAYEIMSPLLVQWKESHNRPLCVEGNFNAEWEVYEHPLVFEPGTSWAYGPGVDWAGRVVEKVCGVSLEKFLTEHIFSPLDIVGEMSFFPQKSILGFEERKVQLVTKDSKTGVLEGEKEEKTYTVDAKECLGGIGMFASPKAFLSILSLLLTGGTIVEGVKILEKSSVDEIFKGQIHDQDVKTYLNGLLNSEYMVSSGMKGALSKGRRVEGGLGCFVGFEHEHENEMVGSGSGTERGEGTISGMGLPNCTWWVDREMGVAGAMFLARTPALDLELARMGEEIERVFYAGL